MTSAARPHLPGMRVRPDRTDHYHRRDQRGATARRHERAGRLQKTTDHPLYPCLTKDRPADDRSPGPARNRQPPCYPSRAPRRGVRGAPARPAPHPPSP